MIKTYNQFIRLSIVNVIIIFIVFAYHYSALNGAWRWDDPVILQDAMNSNFWDYFVKPSSWSLEQLTPWLWFSFHIDYTLFGLEQKWFYIHHLFSVSIIGILTFALLKKWVSDFWAFLGAVLFVVSPAVSVVAQQLMTRQYVEGLIFFIAAILFFIHSLETKNIKHSWLAAFFYLLAASAKEFYVPLIFILFGLSFIFYQTTYKSILKFLFPQILVCIFYVVWRHYMVISKVSSYWDFIKNTNPKIIFNQLFEIPFFSFGKIGGYLLTVTIIVFIIFSIKNYRTQYRNLVLLVATFFALLLPSLASLIGIGEDFNLRYVFLFSWIAIACFILVINYYLNQLIRITLCGIFVISLIMRSSTVHDTLEPVINEVDQTTRFLWSKDKQTKFFLDIDRENTPWYQFLYRFHAIQYIKQRLNSTMPIIVNEVIELQESDTISELNSIYTYQKSCRCIKTLNQAREKYEIQKKKIMDKPLSVQVTTSGNSVSWQLGPYDSGTYYAIVGNSSIPLGKQGRTTIDTNSQAPINFYIKYISPDGWITYSPPFTLLSGNSVLWERN